MKTRCELVSWEEAQLLAKKVATKIKRSKYKPDIVVGISRGGVIPARMICDRLMINNLVSIRMEHWGIAGKITNKAKLTHGLDGVDLKGKRVLLVDDLTDTGESLKVAVGYLKTLKPKEVRTAVLQHKKRSKFVPDYYAEELEKWEWIIYPWMVHEDLVSFITEILKDGKERTLEQIQDALMKFNLKFPDIRILEALEDMEYWKRVKRRVRGTKIYWRLKEGQHG
ncbi:MAG: phosphoribosyltransferase [Candidatus Diapherotrites archaeon]|nr:phosphoribosyltransferase [Candidatus Diapherotrites archaeon]